MSVLVIYSFQYQIVWNTTCLVNRQLGFDTPRLLSVMKELNTKYENCLADNLRKIK